MANIFELAVKMYKARKIGGLSETQVIQFISFFQTILDFRSIVEILLRNHLEELLFMILIEPTLSEEIRVTSIVATFCMSLVLEELAVTLKIWYH